MAGLVLLPALRGRRVDVAPVVPELEYEVKKHKAGYEDLEGGPGL